MSKLTIKLRLSLGFGLVVALLVLVAAISVTRITQINSVTDAILNDRYVKVMLANNMQDEVNLQARVLRNAIIGGKSAEEVRVSLERLRASAKKNDEYSTRLKGMLNTQRGQALFQAMVEARSKYAEARDATVKLVEAGQIEAAGEHLLREVRGPQDRFFDTLANMASFQQSRMTEDGNQAMESGNSAVRFTLGLAAIAAITATVIGMLIARSIITPVSAAVTLAQSVAAGDLTREIEVRSQDEVGLLLQALKDMNGKLKTIVTQVRAGTDEITTASSELAKGNMDLSSRTEQQAGALEETASSMEEMTGIVRQNADNARQANHLAVSATEVARRGGSVVADVVVTMEAINTSANKVVDIIGVIDSIAFQTNILALNAAVEAARAGEQGRGFAVVASEVRSLAHRSAQAAKEIKALITDSLDKVSAGNALVSQAGTTMEEVVLSIQRVTDIMGEINHASREQDAGIQQINEAITEMDTATQRNAALVEQAAAATASLEQQASHLSQIVSVFKLDAGGVNRHGPALQVVGKRALSLAV